MAQYTITFSEQNKGWTSYWDYVPDWMARLNNRFFSIKDGQLWLHNEESAVRNNFYGTQYNSVIKTVFPDMMAEDKVFKTLWLEGDQPWAAELATNYTESSIEADKFNVRESRQFAYIRQNENPDDFSGGATQGIGVIVSSAGTSITMSHMSEFVCIGDVLKQVNGSTDEIIGTITNIVGKVITVASVTTTPVNGFYVFAQKNARVEGADMRGYYLEVQLTNEDTGPGELFAITTNAVKSYV